MAFDLVVLALCALVIAVGALQGGARQLGQLAGWIAGALFAWPAARFLGPLVSDELDWPAPVATLACGLVAFIVSLVVTRLLVADSVKTLLRHEEDEVETQRRDRWLGLAVGAVRAGLATYLVLSALVFVEKNVSSLLGRKVGVLPRDSITLSFARRHGLFQSTGDTGSALSRPLRQWLSLAEASADPEKLSALQRDPAFQSLQQDPRIQQALGSPALRDAVERRDVEALLADPHLRKILADPQLTQRLATGAWASE